MIDLKETLSERNVLKNTKRIENSEQIFEKFVYAIHLLELLSSISNKYEFKFKGGTSLLLLLNNITRFSVDIDLNSCEKNYYCEESMMKDFKSLIKSSSFIDVVLDQRVAKKKNIKCLHYKFSFKPIYKTEEPYIILDIVFADNNFETLDLPIACKSIISNGIPLRFATLKNDDLLGDKLTAVAPRTIGILFTYKDHHGKPKSTEIIKQMYDICRLIPNIASFNHVADVYKMSCQKQISYLEKSKLSLKDCLLDTIWFCKLILSRGVSDKVHYEEIKSGIGNFNSYLIGESIDIIDFEKYAAKILILASKILRKYHKVKDEPENDFWITNKIDRKRINLLLDDKDLIDFKKYCFIS